MKEISTFLDEVTPLLLNHNEEDINSIRERVDDLLESLGVDKKQLVTNWIKINGEEPFKCLQVTTCDEYFRAFNIILLSSLQYLDHINDPLYLLVQISILSDWYCYKCLNI